MSVAVAEQTMERIRFPEPGVVQVERVAAPSGPVQAHAVRVRNEVSLVSAGTELAILTGREFWAPLPYTPGYGSVGVVEAVGSDVSGIASGDRVFCQGPHAAIADVASGPILKVPRGLDPAEAVFSRIGSIAITARWVSEAQLGDRVAVLGLGLVGNLAAQFMTLSGCDVVGVDVDPQRLEIARACGIRHTLLAGEDLPKRARELAGEGFTTVIEATGITSSVDTAVRLARQNGEVILLGSPRQPYTGDTLPVFDAVHHWRKNVTLRGAHECVVPLDRDPDGRIKHSMQRNHELIWQWMLDGRLNVRSLVSHRVRPHEAPQIYAALKNRAPGYHGVLFDWTNPETARDL